MGPQRCVSLSTVSTIFRPISVPFPSKNRTRALISVMRAALPSPLRHLLTPPPMTTTWCQGMKQPRVLIAPTCPANATEGTQEYIKGCILSLRHPKSGSRTGYVFRSGSLQELHWFKQSYGSWFLGDYVREDGSLYIATPVDPVFIFLPVFEEARMKTGNDRGMFRELNEIFYVDGYPAYQHFMPIAEDSMKLLCEMKEIGSSRFFRLDDSKVLAWLCHKVERLKETFSTLDKNYAAREEKDTLIDIVSLLGEYLCDDPWLKLLCSHFQLSLPDANRKSANEEFLMTAVESPVPFVPSQTKNTNGRSSSSTSKQSKKLKAQVDSQNIKDMFRRATRRGGT